MELDSNSLLELWSGHSMTACHEGSDAVLARHAQAMEMGSMDGLLDGVLKLFRINLEKGLGRIPKGMSASFRRRRRELFGPSKTSGKRQVAGVPKPGECFPGAVHFVEFRGG